MRVFLVVLFAATVLVFPRASMPVASVSTLDKIAFVRTGAHGRDIGEIYVMNADGSAERNLTRREFDDQSPRWSPTGRRIAFVGQARGRIDIYVVNADGGAVRRLTRSRWSDSPVWSPDGRRIAFVRRFLDPPGNQTGDTTPEIYVMNADGSRPRRLTRNRLYEFALDWSRRGSLRSCARAALRAGALDGRRDLRDESRWQGRAAVDAKWRPRGRCGVVARRSEIAFVRWQTDQQRSSIFVMNADGPGERRLTPPARFFGGHSDIPTRLVWSPGGKRIATNWGPRLDIYVLNSDGSGRRRVVRNSPGVPTWSPDGRRLAFNRHPAIYIVNADGSGERRIVPRPGRPVFSLGENWSPIWSRGP